MKHSVFTDVYDSNVLSSLLLLPFLLYTGKALSKEHFLLIRRRWVTLFLSNLSIYT